MSKETPSKEKVITKLVKLDNALKLAEAWVNDMSGSAVDESTELELEARPPRLGLGAKFVRQSNIPSTDPIERRLRKKLEAGKRRATKNKEEEANPSDSEDDDDEPQSRTSAFTKKRPIFLSPSLQNKKKSK